MKISEITYNTDISKFLNYYKVEEEIIELETAIQSIKNNLVEQLYHCTATENGGLDPKSFSLEGESLLTDKANECKNSFNSILENCDNLRNKILDSALNHRKEELTRFISCIEERVDNVKVLKNNIVKQIEAVSKKKIFDTNIIEVAKLYAHKENYEKELKELYEKLEWAKKELGKV